LERVANDAIIALEADFRDKIWKYLAGVLQVDKAAVA
jgi:hypothetical protein